MTANFVSIDDIDSMQIEYADRFREPPPLEGIKSCHCIIPLSKMTLLMKLYSAAETCHYTYYERNSVPVFEDLHGFLIISEPEGWHLAFVNDRDEQTKRFEAILMEKSQVPQQFIFPPNQTTVIKHLQDVISVVNVVPIDTNTFKLIRTSITHANCEQEKR